MERSERQKESLIFFFTVCCLLLAAVFCFAADTQQAMESIKKAVRAELARTISGDVELNGIRIVKGVDGLEEGRTYTVSSMRMDGYNGSNKIVYMATLCDDRKVVHRMQVEASYDVLADVFVAARPLSSGSAVGEGDFYVVKQKNSKLLQGTITDIASIKGLKLRANVAQGVVLRSDNFNNASRIKRGKEVVVLVEGANVKVSTKGVLSNDATIGGTARVFCSSPRKEISGILVSADTVKVKI